MQIQVILNDDNFVRSYATLGTIVGSVAAEIEDAQFDDFEINFESYYVQDGCLSKNDDRAAFIRHQEKLKSLRIQRRTYCFPIINRGKLWYDTLTENQLIELNSWYRDWLDVTETEVIPSRPEWIESEEK